MFEHFFFSLNSVGIALLSALKKVNFSILHNVPITCRHETVYKLDVCTFPNCPNLEKAFWKLDDPTCYSKKFDEFPIWNQNFTISTLELAANLETWQPLLQKLENTLGIVLSEKNWCPFVLVPRTEWWPLVPTVLKGHKN